ncbi:flagellar protein FlgN [Methylomonas sp. AM2-LC]|uniref:flagella synthesis protein FlgN n=1 Tax=Methylomonas sp. AM2-LC TaxID=3153301 RepID=UPI003266D228
MIEKTYPITENLLINGLNATQKLLELLHSEAENLLQSKDAQALTHIAAYKKEVVVQLEQFADQLGQVLATEQLLANHTGMNDYLSKAQAAGINIGNSRVNWANLTALSKKCRMLNEQNGACIELLSRHTQRALQILRGNSALSSTYGPDGSTRSELFSKTLISV